MEDKKETNSKSFEELKEYEMSKNTQTEEQDNTEKNSKSDEIMTKASGVVLAGITLAISAAAVGNVLHETLHPEDSKAMETINSVLTDDKDNFEMKYIYYIPEKSYIEGEQKLDDKIINGCYIVTSNQEISEEYLYHIYTPQTIDYQELKQLENFVINNTGIEFEEGLTVAEIAKEYTSTQTRQNADYIATL